MVNRVRTTTGGVLCAILLAASAACTPALNWREVRLDGSGLEAMFPCRPDRHERHVTLAGVSASMQMHVCEAAGLTFAVSLVDVDAPDRVSRAMVELRALAVSNIGATESTVAALQVSGMTPNPQAALLSARGRPVGSERLGLRAAFFSKGLRIFQATVIGAAPTEEAMQPFFAGLRVPA
ncbi:MAG: hypothetical protein ABIO45_11145 [Burkholderiaceae bacterium]